MKSISLSLILLASAATVLRGADIQFTSPGFAPSRMDDQGRLVEDWGAFGVRVNGPEIRAAAPAVSSVTLDEVIPAARAAWVLGAVEATATAFRAPVWPAGLDVYTVQVREKAGRQANLVLTVDVPGGAKPGSKTLSAGGRIVVALPGEPTMEPVMRDWGWNDDAVAMVGWARPAKPCDPAFQSIRAGMGGVPISYRFKVEPRSDWNVVLGFCESHWNQAGQRPVVCKVEGLPAQEVDPIARWGQHQPGLVQFTAKDENGDGFLDVAALPKIGAPDTNPILNVIWLFPPGPGLNLEQVMAGKLNAVATRYVDVGGPGDQPLLATSKVEYRLNLPANGQQEFTFLVASGGGSAPIPGHTAWTVEKLRRAAVEVWRSSTAAANSSSGK